MEWIKSILYGLGIQMAFLLLLLLLKKKKKKKKKCPLLYSKECALLTLIWPIPLHIGLELNRHFFKFLKFCILFGFFFKKNSILILFVILLVYGEILAFWGGGLESRVRGWELKGKWKRCQRSTQKQSQKINREK